MVHYLLESKQLLVKLGFPEIIVTILYERFGTKAPLFAKWYKEYTAFGTNRLNDPNWWRNYSHGFSKPTVVTIVKLYEATKEYQEGKITFEQYNSKRSDLNFASVNSPEETRNLLDKLKGFIQEEFFGEIFFDRNIVKDYMRGKLKNLAPYSKLPFEEANEKYEEKFVFSDQTPIKTYENGWKWIDVGVKCDLIGRKMKNCGSAGLMSYDKARTMLVLFDEHNNPHVVVTYSPNNEEQISAIKGQGETSIKNEYVDYVIDLADTLGVKIRVDNTDSKMLKLKVLLKPVWIKQLHKDTFDEFFEFQLSNGKAFYSNGHEIVSKEQTDNLNLPPEIKNLGLIGRLTRIFNWREKDTILALNPGFKYVGLYARSSLLEGIINDAIKEVLRTAITKIYSS